MFMKCEEVKRWMDDFDGKWMFAGGWAIDLHIGEETRNHEDIEVSIFRDEQNLLQETFHSWDFKFVKEKKLMKWERDVPLDSPIHEIHAFSPEGERLEILLNDRSKRYWRFRRDPSIIFETNRMRLQSEQGFPYLNPEIVLLYKSTSTSEKDHEDFRHVFPYLNEHQKEWLKQSLMHHRPGHPWLEALLF